jgi:hypothetical protein
MIPAASILDSFSREFYTASTVFIEWRQTMFARAGLEASEASHRTPRCGQPLERLLYLTSHQHSCSRSARGFAANDKGFEQWL